MAVHLSGAYLLGYSQTNNFFGDTLFRRGSTATMTVSAIIDVRPGGSEGYPGEANADNLGAKEAFDIINSQAGNIENWQEIKIDYGLGDTIIATGRVVSMESTRQNPVRIGEYNVTLEIPVSGGDEAFNMQGATDQGANDNFQNGFAGNTIGAIFQKSGAAFENFSEQFTFSVSEESSYEYEHSLGIQMISGQHICPDPIQTSKEVAKAIFNVVPNDAPAFGFIDEQFSGFYSKTNLEQAGDVSGVKYFSEAYDLFNLNCSFTKRCVLDGQLKDDYSLTLNHSMTLDERGIVNVTENGSLKSTRNKSIADRFTDVRGFMETEIAGAKTRCESFYDNYLPSGFVDPDYQGERTGGVSDNSQTLVDKPIKIGRNYQPSAATAQYSIDFVNHQGKYTSDFIHEYTQTVNETNGGVINVTENGKIIPYFADTPANLGKAHKSTGFYASGVLIYNDQEYNGKKFKEIVKDRADESYGWYRGEESETFKELLNEHYPNKPNSLNSPSLMPVSKQVTVPRYGVGLDYSHIYSDDPSLLKSSEELYKAGFRKFSVSTKDTFMAPVNSVFTLPALRDGRKIYGRQVVHDGTQTKMGNRSFSIKGFLARPTSNVLSTPSAWGFSVKLDENTNKLNMVKDVISQKMADVIPDLGLAKRHDVFVKNVSFTIDSKGEFSSQGDIPFVQLGGVKHDTLGKLMDK